MYDNPNTLGKQILNLAEGIGIKMKGIKDKIAITDDAYNTFMSYYNGVDISGSIGDFTVDNKVTENSTGLITSGAVFEAIKKSASNSGTMDYNQLQNKPTIPTVTDTYSSTSSNAVSGKAVASALADYVPTSTTVNGKALSDNISLSASDVGALPSDTTIPTITDTYSETGSDAVSGKAVASALESYVPNTRTVNGKTLSTDLILTASDVGALPSSTTIPTVTDTYSATSSNAMSGKAVASAISGFVTNTTTVNGKALSSNVTLTASDVGALSSVAFSDLTSHPDSISGYGITDTYTKTEVDEKLSTVFHYKGSKASEADLPTTENVTGDVWNVEDTGDNYAWTGTEWDKLAGTVDLSGYVPTSRTINSKALSSDITLTAEDVGAVVDGNEDFVKTFTDALDDKSGESIWESLEQIPVSTFENDVGYVTETDLYDIDCGDLSGNSPEGTLLDAEGMIAELQELIQSARLIKQQLNEAITQASLQEASDYLDSLL